jgi:hypothetical protein
MRCNTRRTHGESVANKRPAAAPVTPMGRAELAAGDGVFSLMVASSLRYQYSDLTLEIA